MPVYNGSNEIDDVKLGTTQIEQIYLGTQEIWSNYKEIDLGTITLYPTGDYANNYYSNAHAILIRDKNKWKLKITGYWRSKGNNVDGNVKNFSTNINIGQQKSQITVPCNCFWRESVPVGQRYNVYNGYVSTDGNLYLPLGHENEWRSFNQYDYDHTIIDIDPA